MLTSFSRLISELKAECSAAIPGLVIIVSVDFLDPYSPDVDTPFTYAFYVKTFFPLLFSRASAILVTLANKNAFHVFTRKELHYEAVEN